MEVGKSLKYIHAFFSPKEQIKRKCRILNWEGVSTEIKLKVASTVQSKAANSTGSVWKQE